MYFINTPYRLTLKTNLNLSTATSIIIKHDDPFHRSSGEWAATASGKNAVFNIGENMISKQGTYNLQLIAVIDGVTRRTGIFQIHFSKSSFQ